MKYTAITIGPIYRTFKFAKKTREFWAASYIFSYLMKKIILALKNEDSNINIVIPFTDSVLLTGKNEAGLFPDNLVFHSEIVDINKFKEITDKVLDNIADEIINHINCDNKDYFKNYFQVYAIEKDFADNTLKKDIVKDLLGTLNILELQQKFVPLEPGCNMRSFLTKASFKAGKQHSFLMQDAKELKETDIVRFQSIIEISAKEIIDKLDENKKEAFEEALKNSFKNNEVNDKSLIEILKEHDDFKTHHKYIAILQIDGDSFGKINQYLDNDEYQQFSQALAAYSLQIKDIISDYGGMPIYIGGDDVLAFVPVRNGDKNIFTLLKEIDEIFKQKFKYFIEKNITDEKGNKITPSLSAGISVTYYKYPLKEALDLSYNLLRNKAKNYQEKNAVAFQVIKHSGQTFCTVFNKKSKIYEKFNDLIKLNIDDSQFFSSVIQKFFENFELLRMIGQDKNRIKAYRENFFNENFHGTKDKFLDELENYIQLLFTTNIPKTDNKIKEKLYASLRMVKFLNRDDNE